MNFTKLQKLNSNIWTVGRIVLPKEETERKAKASNTQGMGQLVHQNTVCTTKNGVKTLKS